MARPGNPLREVARALVAPPGGSGGLRRSEVAAKLGVPLTTVHNWCKGLPLAPPGNRPRPVDLDAIREAREAGATWREVEQLTGVSKSVAHARARAYPA
jgi:DNA-binding IclR family transcriptional regulator